ncbi:hypothetical protein EPI10_005212 [Gossypium australe]|uniref:Uncharacterized protein n=1 Tax=Gossypium australe TaxID=47621 RepID=A0A5B6WMD8_9ROSI|nr:hypothetical protein EPI10_005212 [Gossypium australe]
MELKRFCQLNLIEEKVKSYPSQSDDASLRQRENSTRGNLMLKHIFLLQNNFRGKHILNWEIPYIEKGLFWRSIDIDRVEW